MSSTPVSGTQHSIRAGTYAAEIASVGASLRSLRHADRDLVVPFSADELRPSYRGTTLAPWPNRVVDGRYSFDGQEFQLSLTEPGRGHALHGLAAWLAFDVVGVREDSVQLAATIEPQTGYPWRVQVETTYGVGPSGLTQAVKATNLSASRAPWGTGPHPYLVAGIGPLDDWVLELPAGSVLEVTADRLAPVGLASVDGANAERFDFRSGRRLGPVQIDHAFTGLAAAADGSVTVRLTTASGPGVAMSWDDSCPWVQIHTADLPGGPTQAGHRAGLAVEPMTCAPDAFNTESYEHGTGLLVLEPGASVEVSWTIEAIT